MSASPPSAGDILQLVSFIVEQEEFGVEILRVQEIIRPVTVTRIPNAPGFVEGVINLRGKIVPVIDLRRRFGLERRALDKDSRVIVVEMTGRVIGFMVDAVREVVRISRSVVEPPPDLTVGVDTRYIRGVAKLEDRLVILLDLEEVLSGEEARATASFAEAA